MACPSDATCGVLLLCILNASLNPNFMSCTDYLKIICPSSQFITGLVPTLTQLSYFEMLVKEKMCRSLRGSAYGTMGLLSVRSSNVTFSIVDIKRNRSDQNEEDTLSVNINRELRLFILELLGNLRLSTC
jgi:hypothetical protein